jgi:hypothetical protein
MKKLLINQPGRHGDILICLPIAEHYSKEYEVSWFCPSEYHINFRNVDYCHPVSEIKEKYAKIIDLSFGIVQGTPLHDWWLENRHIFLSFVQTKYQLANVPLYKRKLLSWVRDLTREEDLYRQIVDKHGQNYILCHEVSHDGISIFVERDNKVLFKMINDFNIFDWYKVIINAKEIHCIDSSLCNFVEVLSSIWEIPKYYYITRKVPNIWDRTILNNNWVIVNE